MEILALLFEARLRQIKSSQYTKRITNSNNLLFKKSNEQENLLMKLRTAENYRTELQYFKFSSEEFS